MDTNLSRRNVLKLGAGVAAFALLGTETRAMAPVKKIPIGLQLYSIRNQCAADGGKGLVTCLEALGKMGYNGVEFAGYYGWEKKPKDLRKLLDDNGLKCCGTHTGWGAVQPNNLKATVALHQELGCNFIIIPGGLPKESFETADGMKNTAKFCTTLSASLKPDSMFAGYHAHGGDAKKLGDLTAWEVLFDNTPPEFLMQMDVGNFMGGGGDPYAMIKKYPGRSKTIHIKEHGGKPGAVIGEGTIKWKELFEMCEGIGGTQWYVVEHESDPKTPLESVKKCIDALRGMGK